MMMVHPRVILTIAAVLATTIPAQAQTYCPDQLGPDVIVGVLPGIQKWGTVGGVTGYSIATTSCNIGSSVLPWFAATNQHPVIAQHMYKLDTGSPSRLTQIGISWVKHGFGSLQETGCCPDCIPAGTFDALGVGCSDPYTTGLNGNQPGFGGVAGLGPRSEVNAATGLFSFPYGWQGLSGDAIYKRLQVHNADLDPALNVGARYFGEGQYVTPDDAAASNHRNNASHRELLVGGPNGGGWDLSFTGPTLVMEPGLFAWRNFDPIVEIVALEVPFDGRMYVASRATDNGDGTWHYEYAVHNLSSHRSAGRFRVTAPLSLTVTGIGFHDVDYHSGEPFDLTDWTGVHADGLVAWQTSDFLTNPNANAVRWGTLYNYWFDADAPPGQVGAELGMFLPGSPSALIVVISGPVPNIPCAGDITPAGGNGVVNIDDLVALLNAFGPCPVPPAACLADITPPGGNGAVNIDDLVGLLNAFGNCP